MYQHSDIIKSVHDEATCFGRSGSSTGLAMNWFYYITVLVYWVVFGR